MTEYVYVCGECTDCAITTDERLSNRLSCPNCDAEVDLADETPDVRDDEIEQGDYGVSDMWDYKGDVKPSHSETPKEAVKRKIELQSESESVNTDYITIGGETDDSLKTYDITRCNHCDHVAHFIEEGGRNLCGLHLIQSITYDASHNPSNTRVELVSTDKIIEFDDAPIEKQFHAGVILNIFTELNCTNGKLVYEDGIVSVNIKGSKAFKSLNSSKTIELGMGIIERIKQHGERISQ
jgi:DNA-directed RNA polymerase subunit RPC12/RpoP